MSEQEAAEGEAAAEAAEAPAGCKIQIIYP